jgi:hypothetical protein
LFQIPCTRNTKNLGILSIPFSTVVVVTDSETSKGLKLLAGVCLLKTFGNHKVVSDVRLHNSYFCDNVQC